MKAKIEFSIGIFDYHEDEKEKAMQWEKQRED